MATTTKKATTPAVTAVKKEEVKAVETVKAAAETKKAPVEKKAPAAKKAAPAKKTAEKKAPAAKKAAPAKKAPAKKTAPTTEELCAMLREKVAKKNVSSITEKTAVEIKVYGEYEAYLYIEIKDGAVSVEPYGYIGNDVHVDLPINDLIAIVNGKYDYKAKILSGDFYAIGKLTDLLKVKEALF